MSVVNAKVKEYRNSSLRTDPPSVREGGQWGVPIVLANFVPHASISFSGICISSRSVIITCTVNCVAHFSKKKLCLAHRK